MKAHLVRIGNSRGVRLAKSMLEEAGLTDEVEIRARHGAIIITAAVRPRTGWAAAAARIGEASGLIDAPTATRFDEDEWEWR